MCIENKKIVFDGYLCKECKGSGKNVFESPKQPDRPLPYPLYVELRCVNCGGTGYVEYDEN